MEKPAWVRNVRAVKTQPATLGAIALGVLALALVAIVSTTDLQPTAGRAAAKPAGSPSDTVSPSPTPVPTPSPSTSPTPPPSPAPPPDPYLHVGSTGPDVLALQQKLNSLTDRKST